MRPRDMHVKRLHGGAHAADGFARPKRLTQDREPAIFQFTDYTKSITRVVRLVRVQTAPGEVAFQFRVRRQGVWACAQAKRLSLKAFQQFAQLLFAWLRHNDAAARRFAKGNFARGAEIADAVEVAEKIEHERFLRNQGREDSRPDGNCVGATYRLPALGFDQLHADGLNARPQDHRFHIESTDR